VNNYREWISGRNPVYETLRAGRRHAFHLRIAQGVQEKSRLDEIVRICRQRNLPIDSVPRGQLDARFPNNQGVALEVSGYPYSDLTDMLALAERRGEPPLLLVLDAMQDPQNLGALLRTAEIVGVHGVLLPLRHTVTVTPAVVHASSGASEHLLISQGNLAQALETLKRENVWVVGLEGNPQAQTPEQVHLDGPLALVVGSEGEGMRSLVRASCDLLLRLPMRGRIESLNAAVAGSVALYLVWQARGWK
jgi:23S rRNA (guanosine2251-2'-O)-methyltransferase